MRKPMTLTQKILAAHAIGHPRPWVEAGDVLRIKVDWTIASELAWNGMARTWELLGKPAVHDRERFYLAIDHTVDPVTLASDKRAQKLTQLSRDFAKESGIQHFYDANETILHTRFYRDLVQPGEVVLGADSHTSSHGGMGAFAIGLGGADITAAMVLGESWIEVPEAIAVDYEGELPFGIGGKDVILETLGKLGRNTVAMERSVEYRGEAVRKWSTDVRFTIANMTAEFGGLNGIFEPDAVVADWVSRRNSHNDAGRYFRADDDAPYLERFRIDLSKLGPVIARPFSPDNVFGVETMLGMELQGAFIGACTTTEEELVLGALVLEQALAQGMKPVATQKRLVVPGDLAIMSHLRETGLLAIYEKAGFRVGPPGCSMCLGIASERAEKGEHWITSQNRNFENRMGEGSFAYLASAATVAASATMMKVADPRPLLAGVDQERYAELLRRKNRLLPEIRTTEPEVAIAPAHAGGAAGAANADAQVLRGGVQRFGDSVDTDAIIPGDFCHLTDLAEIGAKCFHFVRPEFVGRAKEGRNVIVAGEGWGSGSSREHAVWALKGAGVQAVIAKSYAFIHKRNLVNEALPYLVVKDEAFYELAGEGEEIAVDLAGGTVTHVGSGRSFAAQPLAQVVQALAREGGLVPAIQRHGNRVFSVLSAG
ncbi:aconitase family protein [Vulgatibacter sp.]|uniref:LeuD/DmdB family oxidoreductase small subunit n=1 Tax=Vulgatibacter sp. TaxID=1971226 RepID=UPI0035652B38